MLAELDLLEEAKKQNENAIIVLNNSIESQMSCGISVSRGFIDDKQKLNDTRHLKIHFIIML